MDVLDEVRPCCHERVKTGVAFFSSEQAAIMGHAELQNPQRGPILVQQARQDRRELRTRSTPFNLAAQSWRICSGSLGSGIESRPHYPCLLSLIRLLQRTQSIGRQRFETA
jgi:hypothetical protein